MVKLIDAAERLSLQAHPDDATAIKLGAGAHTAAQAWSMRSDSPSLDLLVATPVL